MAGKSEEIFQRVYNAINGMRARGPLPEGALKMVLSDQAIDLKDWYSALARAKKVTPNLYELLYRNLGKEPRAARTQAVETEEAEEEAEEETTIGDVFTTCLHWLERIEDTDRQRVLQALLVFFPRSA